MTTQSSATTARNRRKVVDTVRSSAADASQSSTTASRPEMGCSSPTSVQTMSSARCGYAALKS
jgi:hypothetical protein